MWQKRVGVRALTAILLASTLGLAAVPIDAGKSGLKSPSRRSSLVLVLRVRSGQEAVDFRDREFILSFENRSDHVITINLNRTSPAGMAWLVDRRGSRVATNPVSPPRPLTDADVLTLEPGEHHDSVGELVTLTGEDLDRPPYRLHFCYSNQIARAGEGQQLSRLKACSNAILLRPQCRRTSACSGARAARSFRLPLTPSRAPADA